MLRPQAKESHLTRPISQHAFRGAKTFRLLWLVAATLFVFSTIVAVSMGFHPLFLQDTWEMVDFYRLWKENGVGFSEFWAQHNEHRIPTLKFILWMDLLLENGTGFLVVILIFLFQFLHLGLMAKVISREERLDPAARMFLIGTAAILFFWLRQRENFVWTFQVSWSLNALMVSGAACLVAGLGTYRQGQGGKMLLKFAGVALASVVAATTLASGLLLPLVLAVVLWKTPVPRRAVIGWVAFAGLLFLAYLAGYVSPPHHEKAGGASVVEIVLYFLAYLGNPVALNGIPVQAALFPGLAVLGLYSGFAIRFLRASAPGFLDLFSFAVATQVVLMAGLTAVGRHALGLDQVSVGRYSMPVLILWFTLAMWGFASTAARPRARRRWQCGVVALMAFLVWPTQALLVPRTIGMYRAYDEASLALMAGVDDRAVTRLAYPFPERLWTLNAVARAYRLSFYEDAWRRWPRQGFGRMIQVDTAEGWRAVVSDRRAAGTLGRAGFYVNGRVAGDGDLPRRGDFVLTRGDSIVGYARGSRRGCPACFSGYVSGSAGFDLHLVTQPASGLPRATYIP